MSGAAFKYDDGLDADGYAIGTADPDGGVAAHPGWRFIHGSEEDAGDFRPLQLGAALMSVIERLRLMFNVSPSCESPIEVQLGAATITFFERAGVRLQLCKSFSYDNAPIGLLFVPQFRWGRYRSDWAILDARSHGALLVECDGAAWHSSEAQKAHDAKKDLAALDMGFVTLRFTGSQIFRDADGCAQKVYDAVCGGR